MPTSDTLCREKADVRSPSAVMPREGGASSTPRLLGSIAEVSGILDRPVKPGDDP